MSVESKERAMIEETFNFSSQLHNVELTCK